MLPVRVPPAHLPHIRTPSDVRAFYDATGHFFDRATMRFFGDRMRSFGLCRIKSVVYLYRKPTAQVNVFGRWCRAGRNFFNAWCIEPMSDAPDCEVSINLTHDDETETVYQHIRGRF